MFPVYGQGRDGYGAKESQKSLCALRHTGAAGLEARGQKDCAQPLLAVGAAVSGRGVFGHGVHRLAGCAAPDAAEVGYDFKLSRVLRQAGRGGEQPRRVRAGGEQNRRRFASGYCEQHRHVAGGFERMGADDCHCGEQFGFGDILGVDHEHVRRHSAPSVHGDARL